MNFKIDGRNKEISIGRQWKDHSLYKPIGANNQVLSINEYSLEDINDFCSFIKQDFPTLLRLENLKITILENGIKKEFILKKEFLIQDK